MICSHRKKVCLSTEKKPTTNRQGNKPRHIAAANSHGK